MTAAPLCRYCGKPLTKRTTTRYVRATPTSPGWSKDDVVGIFKNKSEVEQVTNQQITSLKYHETSGSWGEADTVWCFNTWDGESYQSVHGQGFFCTQACAVRFAGLYAKEGKVTSAYNAALAKQQGGQLKIVR